MDETFVSNGLESDRYLKGAKLVADFESEITEAIDQVCQEIMASHPRLFEEDATRETKLFRTGGSKTLATLRVEVAMTVENDEEDTLKLNMGLEWVEPGQQEHDDSTEGSLCYVLYKIQHGASARFDTVKQRTESEGRWEDVYFGEDQWFHPSKHAPGIVYIPVETGAEITDRLQILREHFTGAYAPELRN